MIYQARQTQDTVGLRTDCNDGLQNFSDMEDGVQAGIDLSRHAAL